MNRYGAIEWEENGGRQVTDSNYVSRNYDRKLVLNLFLDLLTSNSNWIWWCSHICTRCRTYSLCSHYTVHTTLHTQALNLVALFNVCLFVCQIFGTRASTKISNRSVPCLCFCCYLLFPVCANVCFFDCGGNDDCEFDFWFGFWLKALSVAYWP